MEQTTTTNLTYDEALEIFLGTDASYAGGLSNHGPMATEALVSMGIEPWIGPFVSAYRTRLEPPHDEIEPAPLDWATWLRAELPALVGTTATLAGHGLLRVAHAVRGLERETGEASLIRRRELGAAVHYWRSGGRGLGGPERLDGHQAPDEWSDHLGRLPADQRRAGNLMGTLHRAASTDGFPERIRGLEPAPTPGETLDALATAAAGAYLRNTGLAAFTLLHGTTVSAMARQLLPHLDEVDGHRLEAAVATFVGAALIGFDEGVDDPVEGATALADTVTLASRAGASLDDHTIKFADACLGVASRTGSTVPLLALSRQIEAPYGTAR